MAHFRERRHSAVTRHARQTVVTRHHQHMLALPAGHQRSRVHDHDAGTCTARLNRQTGAGVDAQVFAEHRSQHQMRLGERVGAQHAVDVRQCKPRIGHRANRGLGVQRHAAAARQLAHGGVVGTGDESVHAHGLNPRSRAMILR
ncbi:hypothetical protein SDC9_197998 [bioreactor metagenome]|uniref:Uncharacterized protein n=1 Tax=bioreactor metagenome TaxID=1076179 RepID=A0A645IHQ8_9ZZZZ